MKGAQRLQARYTQKIGRGAIDRLRPCAPSVGASRLRPGTPTG